MKTTDKVSIFITLTIFEKKFPLNLNRKSHLGRPKCQGQCEKKVRLNRGNTNRRQTQTIMNFLRPSLFGVVIAAIEKDILFSLLGLRPSEDHKDYFCCE